MIENDAIKLFKCLADKSRLQILKSLVKEDMYVELLAERLNLTPATISFHLKKLMDAQAVKSYKDQYYTMYSIREDIFMTSILEIIKEESDEAAEQKQREDTYRKKVLNSFFEYGKLKLIPSQRKKEIICLEEIAKSFTLGKEYEETEVNDIIQGIFDDYCSLRRDMISFGIMVRDKSIYKRVK